ncbi:MAG: hypothetical protein IJR34_07280 [Bacteroidales bacterium]|nr:hypothetical protein [Bacteroidales bacterium]
MEKIKILEIRKSQINESFGENVPSCEGNYYMMTIKSLIDDVRHEVYMIFDISCKRICANDYNSNLQFKFVDENIDIQQCVEGEEYEVEVVKMTCEQQTVAVHLEKKPL